MITVHVPCHKSLAEFRIDKKNHLGNFIPQCVPPVSDPAAEVRRALAEPIGSPRLKELAQKAETCVIICSDHTRPVPSTFIIPAMLEELRAGNPVIDITLLIATGVHRASSREELVQKWKK